MTPCGDEYDYSYEDTATCQLDKDHEGPHLWAGENEIRRGAPERL
ncbi:MAG: hypothetical protein QOD63_84, partial [Actinomycetota bacterium]|nr:hypothetical protein [Actinomycetota bacterium]